MHVFQKFAGFFMKNAKAREERNDSPKSAPDIRKRTHRVLIRMTPEEHSAFRALKDLTSMSGVRLFSAWATDSTIRKHAGDKLANRIRQMVGLLHRDAIEREKRYIADAEHIREIAVEIDSAAEVIREKYGSIQAARSSLTPSFYVKDGGRGVNVCLRCTDEEYAAAKAKAGDGGIARAFRKWVLSHDVQGTVPLDGYKETLDDLGRDFIDRSEYCPIAEAVEIRDYVQYIARCPWRQ